MTDRIIRVAIQGPPGVGSGLIGGDKWTPTESIVTEPLKFIGSGVFGSGNITNGGYTVDGNGGKFFYSENSVAIDSAKRGFYFNIDPTQFVQPGGEQIILGFTDSLGFPPTNGMVAVFVAGASETGSPAFAEWDFSGNGDVINNGGTINPSGSINTFMSYSNLSYGININGAPFDYPELGFISFPMPMPGFNTWQTFLNLINTGLANTGTGVTASFVGARIRFSYPANGASNFITLSNGAGANVLPGFGIGTNAGSTAGVDDAAAIPFSYMIGNLPIGDISVPAELPATVADEFCIAASNAGAFGEVFLYQNGNLVSSFELTQALGATVDQLVAYLGTSSVIEINIIQIPVNPIIDVIQQQTTGTGGVVDTASYPAGRENKSFEIEGLAAPLMSEKGLLENGSIVIFNSNGDILTPIG